MSNVELFVFAALTLALVLFGGLYLRERLVRSRVLSPSANRILFPFTGHALSRRALDAALRLALAEHATLVPVFLARVPMNVPLDSPLPRQCTAGMPLLETIEQRAAALGVPVDARIERGRTLRHAMREAVAHERYDQLVVAAGPDDLHGEDVAWLLDNAPGELVIIRPEDDDRIQLRRPRRAASRTSDRPLVLH
jgi:nucleotide-binding universal stress UspA family protein